MTLHKQCLEKIPSKSSLLKDPNIQDLNHQKYSYASCWYRRPHQQGGEEGGKNYKGNPPPLCQKNIANPNLNDKRGRRESRPISHRRRRSRHCRDLEARGELFAISAPSPPSAKCQPRSLLKASKQGKTMTLASRSGPPHTPTSVELAEEEGVMVY
jgi:hypothetical protein